MGVVLKVCIGVCIVVRFPCFWNKQQIFTLFNGARRKNFWSPNIKNGSPTENASPRVKTTSGDFFMGKVIYFVWVHI